MITPLSPSDAERFRGFLNDSGYTDAGVTSRLEVTQPPALRGEELGSLEAKLGDPSPFYCLACWFYCGITVSNSVAKEEVPAWLLELALAHGMLRAEGERVHPNILLVPVETSWIASDLHQQRRSGEDHVLPVNRPARTLANFVIRRPVEEALDLCSGNGLHSIILSRFAERVTSADLIPRSGMFADFNAALNGCRNLTALIGDRFKPVEGRQFDLIVCNPPFVISPEGELVYQTNDLKLDRFCHDLIRETPRYLTEGGVAQFVCEWVKMPGQDWKERLHEWTSGIGCDVWVWMANTQLPESYARTRGFDPDLTESEEEERFQMWRDYLEKNDVEAVHGGIIILRRREGQNWTRFEELSDAVLAPVSDDVYQCMRTQDLLNELSDEALLQRTLTVSPALRLEESSHWSQKGWEVTKQVLSLSHHLLPPVGIEGPLKTLVTACGAEVPLTKLLEQFAVEVGAEVEDVRVQGVAMARVMLKRGVLQFSER